MVHLLLHRGLIINAWILLWVGEKRQYCWWWWCAVFSTKWHILNHCEGRVHRKWKWLAFIFLINMHNKFTRPITLITSNIGWVLNFMTRKLHNSRLTFATLSYGKYCLLSLKEVHSFNRNCFKGETKRSNNVPKGEQGPGPKVPKTLTQIWQVCR